MISQPTVLEEKNEQSEPGHPDQTNELPASPPSTAAADGTEPISSERKKPSYKSVPEDWKAIPPGRFRKAIGHLEAVLLEISADGTLTSNLFDWKPTLPTLQAWADHLRAALKDLTK